MEEADHLFAGSDDDHDDFLRFCNIIMSHSFQVPLHINPPFLNYIYPSNHNKRILEWHYLLTICCTFKTAQFGRDWKPSRHLYWLRSHWFCWTPFFSSNGEIRWRTVARRITKGKLKFKFLLINFKRLCSYEGELMRLFLFVLYFIPFCYACEWVKCKLLRHFFNCIRIVIDYDEHISKIYCMCLHLH